MTGLHSSKILGESLDDLLDKKDTNNLPSLTACAELSAAGRRQTVALTRKRDEHASDKEAAKCYMKVTPIISLLQVQADPTGTKETKKVVTHYALDFLSLDYESNALQESEHQIISNSENRSRNKGLVTTVVG